MIKIDDNVKIDANQLSLLKQKENEIKSFVKSKTESENIENLSVVFGFFLSKKIDSDIYKIESNASFAIENSYLLLNAIQDFLDKAHNELKIALCENLLKVKLTFTEKEMTKKNDSEDALPMFIPVNGCYDFSQMILEEKVKAEIMDALKVIESKELIYKTWGFEEVDSVPRSILNFYGEPGTGKTMCAHAIARHLGKKLLALNYSEIESKYVGEAAKNLKHAFETATKLDAILFFDEADSFLGKRIENVSHGSDQALNSLRSQMLILLEQFEGVILFATNLVTNFDRAFESRILKHIKFELPNREARAAILRKMIPSKLPMKQAITDEELLEISDIIDGFSGREIKSGVLDLLLSKASPETVFSAEDFVLTFKKRKEQKEKLKEEETNRTKERIMKKLQEKSMEEAEKKSEETKNE